VLVENLECEEPDEIHHTHGNEYTHHQ
jgi:hypothetical protein